MSVKSTKTYYCDNTECYKMVTVLEKNYQPDFLPERWIRVRANSLSTIFDIVEYDLCSIECYSTVMKDIDELLSQYDSLPTADFIDLGSFEESW